MKKPKIYDPLFSKSVKNVDTEITAASIISGDICQPNTTPMMTLVAANETPPKSPISGEPMTLLECGSFGSAPIRVWAHVADRLVVPVRE